MRAAIDFDAGNSDECKLITIPTYGRQAALKRCMSEAVQNIQRFGRSATVIISDGSCDAEIDWRIKNTVDELPLSKIVRFIVIDDEMRSRLISSLIRDGFDRDTIKFGLLGGGVKGLVNTGANRNLLLLAAGPRSFISIDDDVQFKFALGELGTNPNNWNGDVQIAADGDGIEHWVYNDRQSLLESVQMCDADLLGMHQILLGSSINYRADERSVSRKVHLTANGIVGDCGWGTPSQYLFLDVPSLNRITASEHKYLSAIKSREVLRISAQLTISKTSHNFMSTAFGVDGRYPFPPFMPVGRGSDMIFGRMLKVLDPDFIFLNLPFAIYHSPLTNRRFWPGELLRSARSVDISTMMWSIIATLSASGARTLQDLGEKLQMCANPKVNDFAGFLRQIRKEVSQQRIETLENLLNNYEGVAWSFSRDVRSYIERLHEQNEMTDAGVAVELLYGANLEAAIETMRSIVQRYGKLLCEWSHIREASKPWSSEVLS